MMALCTIVYTYFPKFIFSPGLGYTKLHSEIKDNAMNFNQKYCRVKGVTAVLEPFDFELRQS